MVHDVVGRRDLARIGVNQISDYSARVAASVQALGRNTDGEDAEKEPEGYRYLFKQMHFGKLAGGHGAQKIPSCNFAVTSEAWIGCGGWI